MLLRPQHFRFIVPWDVLDDPGIRAQVADRIGLARATGATEVAISFGTPVAPVSPDVWLDRVARYVATFSPSVSWWSPANEPNHPSSGWMSSPEGAATLAAYSRSLSALLTITHPTDRLLSPDFHDDYGRDNLVRRDANGDSTVELYVRAFLAAGGTLGDAVAWHPYDGAMRQSLESTTDLLDNVLHPDAPPDVWITEVGGILERRDSDGAIKIALTSSKRTTSVSVAGPLAAQPRVSQDQLYHMRDHNPVWDSALVDELGARRPLGTRGARRAMVATRLIPGLRAADRVNDQRRKNARSRRTRGLGLQAQQGVLHRSSEAAGAGAPDGAGGRRRRVRAAHRSEAVLLDRLPRRGCRGVGCACGLRGGRAPRSSTPSTPRRWRRGATDNGGPGKREIYHPHYYGAYVLDPDANNVEAVCHRPA